MSRETGIEMHESLTLVIAGKARREFGLEEALFDERGRAVLGSQADVRRLAAALDGDSTWVGTLEALAVLERVYRELIEQMKAEGAVGFLERADEELQEVLVGFVERFPPGPVFRAEVEADDYVERREVDRHRLLVDAICAQIAYRNAPEGSVSELFDVRGLPDLLGEEFEATSATSSEGRQKGLDLLLAPMRRAPEDLDEQLRYVHRRWGGLLPEWLDRRLLTAIDILGEQEALRGEGPPGEPVVETPGLGGSKEPRRYSRDRDWMPSLVLVAKNARVWMRQLAERYDRPVERLDEIPRKALERLADRGMTGLWLIGIWERSRASERIKRNTGNLEAVASAYAIDRYEIAGDLGGRAAKVRLEEMAADCGIRLAADMVPNHMGIDSQWVVEHPERFLSLDHPPFGAYTFEGPDLCDDERVRIRLEDHYYDESDAAVVFEHTDLQTGRTRYIYHGNDGTSTPWNDTAQIDFLDTQAREAVIETIVDVARRFPVIRFDAAMALAREQIHRLWYPAPGEGSTIPSRAAHGMTDEEFAEAMPREFWREVVERIQREAPETLLLAEAFWKMEGYFVRSLGMHRVYNSAFMHMLRDEDNAGYRELLEETLAFDPQILERYVNFMNNPDEETALEQFGSGDKYFGVCVLMATLPGLPMFGHGQVEGLAEKYGMDFDRPLLEEAPDENLVERHRRQIAPLLKRREWFAGVERFRLYECRMADGQIDENVFAYSNGVGEQRSLIVYHNRYGETDVRVEGSTEFRAIGTDGEGELARETLAEALGIERRKGEYLAFRDHLGGREYLRDVSEVVERGLSIELEAYEARVYVDFEVVGGEGDDEPYGELEDRLEGDGVEDLGEALRRVKLEPVREAARQYFTSDRLMAFGGVGAVGEPEVEEVTAGAERLAEVAETQTVESFDGYAEATEEAYMAAWRLGELESQLGPAGQRLGERCGGLVPTSREEAGEVAGWVLFQGLGGVGGEDSRQRSAERVRRLGLDEPFRDALQGASFDKESARRVAELVVLLVRQAARFEEWPPGGRVRARAWVEGLVGHEETRGFLGINEYDGIRWFHDESIQRLLAGLARITGVRVMSEAQTLTEAAERFERAADLLLEICQAAETAASRIDRLIGGLQEG